MLSSGLFEHCMQTNTHTHEKKKAMKLKLKKTNNSSAIVVAVMIPTIQLPKKKKNPYETQTLQILTSNKLKVFYWKPTSFGKFY